MERQSESSEPILQTSFGEQFSFRKTAEETGGELLRLETHLDPGVRRPLHSHPRQEERFLVKEGVLSLAIEDRELLLESGEKETVPAGTPHTFWRAGSGPTRFMSEHRPALRFGDFLRAMVQLDREGRLGEDGMPANLIDGASLLVEFSEEMRPNDVPAVVQDWVFPAIARLGRALGQEVPGYSTPIDV